MTYPNVPRPINQGVHTMCDALTAGCAIALEAAEQTPASPTCLATRAFAMTRV